MGISQKSVDTYTYRSCRTFHREVILILIDAHSKWLEVHIVPTTSSGATIDKLKTIFATHGNPEQLVSDNWSGFTSEEFETFLKDRGIVHSLTAP